MSMEFLRRNHINTTSMVKVDANNTSTVEFLFDKNRKLGWVSSGYDSTTVTTISIELDTPTVLSHVILQGHNIKNYTLYYNSSTGNSLASSTNNSATSTYFEFSSVTVSSIQFDMNAVITSGEEKSINEMIISERELIFERNPDIRDFRPEIRRKQIRHVMPDGGVILFNIRDKYKTRLSWDFVTETFKNNLEGLYETALPLVFVPEPTSTGWNGQAYECVWSGDFDFNYSSNVKTSGWGGNIDLEEVPG